MCPATVGRGRADRASNSGQAKLWVLLVGVNQYDDPRFPALSYSALDCQGLGEAIGAATQTVPQRTVLIHHDFVGQSQTQNQGKGDRGNTLEFNQPYFEQHYSEQPYSEQPYFDQDYTHQEYRPLSEQIAVTGRMPLETIAKLRYFPGRLPRLPHVRASLQQVVLNAQPQDTVLFYFSGHGILDPVSQQAVLCLADTNKDHLLKTGLGIQELLSLLTKCAAYQQIVWLDACHSGGMTLGMGNGKSTNASFSSPTALPNPTSQLVDLLRQRAAQSKGFYALLSCDQNQQSWEFPELGHGVFTYYLMRGLLGEAANSKGVIEADALYKYVYYQTLRYIDKTNQQLRLINQQKRGRGETRLEPEYPLQTPKRIVEGIGELILGTKPKAVVRRHPRQALVIEGIANNPVTLALSRVLQREGQFELSYVPQSGKDLASVREAIQGCLQSGTGHRSSDEATVLLYLRGRVEQGNTGEAQLVLRNNVAIARSWLRQALRRSSVPRQIVILDCPGATDLAEWVDDLQMDADRGQCVMAVVSPDHNSECFAAILLETLKTADPQLGLSIAGWIAHIQAQLLEAGIVPHLWLSGTQGVMDVVPGQVGDQNRESGQEFDLGICPYLGLRAFSEDNAPFFFGRESLTQQLINAISQRSFLAVVGASGSGKSSVVQAGLMAQLRRGNQLPDSHHWWIGSFRPGSRPLEALVQCLVDRNSGDGNNDRGNSDDGNSGDGNSDDGHVNAELNHERLHLEGMLHLGTEGFVHWLRSRSEPMIVLVVDQFEELFTLASADERQQFLDLMFGAIEYAGDRFKLIITLRTDFMAPCLEYPPLAEALQQSSVLVSPVLNEDDYRRVIVQPAEKVGLTVEPQLVTVLLEELSHQAGDLPLLEFVLEQLWEHRRPGTLTLQGYQEQIGGLKGALERKAQAVYDNLDAEAKACARWIFLSLTQLGEGTEDTRRRVHKRDLIVKKYPADLVDRTLHALTAAKLVIVATDDKESGEEGKGKNKGEGDELSNSNVGDINPESIASSSSITIEVAHEILIRHWSTLRWWLEENRTRLRTLRQIEQAASQWTQGSEQSDFLLRGVRLDAAEELYIKYTDELSEEVQRFIEAGLDGRDREHRQAKQRLKRAQMAIALIGTLGLAATGFGGVAYLQQQRALLNEITALNALSESQLLAHQQIEALTTSLQASQKLENVGGLNLAWLGIDAHTVAQVQTQTTTTLQQAIDLTQERNRFLGHSQRVTSIDTSPDGQRIASGSDDATVRIWTLDGMQAQMFTMPDRVTAVAFSPDGQTLAASSADGSILVWSVEEGRVRSEIDTGAWVTSLAFSPDGQTLAIGSRDRTMKLWNVANGSLVRSFSGHSGWVNSLAFSPDGNTVVSASEDGTLKLWNVGQGILIRTLNGHQARVNSVAFSADSQMVLSGSDDRTIRLWNVATGMSQALSDGSEASHGDRVTSVSFTPNLASQEQRIVSASTDGTLRLWQTDGTLLQTITLSGSDALSLGVTPDGATLISGGTDTLVRLWDIPPSLTSQGHAYTFSLSPDDRTIASAGFDGMIQLWQHGSLLEQPLKQWSGHTAPISTLAFGPGGELLASGSDDQTVKLWDSATGNLQRSLTGHQSRVASVAFSPNGNWLASGSDDQTVKLWDTETGQLLTTLTGHEDGVSSVAFSPNRSILASGSFDSTVNLWQTDGTLVRTLSGHGLAITSIAFSPDGRLLASASYDQTVKLWRVRDGRLLHTFTGHQGGVTSVAFSPDGHILITGSADRTIKLWDVNTGRLIKTLVGQPDAVLGIRLSANGESLFSVGESMGVQQWTLNMDRLVEHGCDRLQDYLAHHSDDTYCVFR